jgi:hypothetical protein
VSIVARVIGAGGNAAISAARSSAVWLIGSSAVTLEASR